MMEVTVCFAGRMGSGKSAVSTVLATRLNANRVSFGDYVRAVARERNLDVGARTVLADLGAQLIESMGWPEFCRTVLESQGWQHGKFSVIDGIRHKAALDSVRLIVAPSTTYLVYLLAENEQVLLNRRNIDGATLAAQEEHSTEVEVKTALVAVADLLLDAEKNAEALVDEIVDFLRRQIN
jgi:dephospho-CoA kinase